MKNIFKIFVFVFIISCTNKNTNIEIKWQDLKYKSLSNDKKLKFLDSIRYNEKYDTNLYFLLAEEYFNLNQYKNYKSVSEIVLNESIKSKDSINIGRAYYYIGDYFELTQKDSAYYYYKQAEKIFIAIKNNDRLAKALFNKGYLLFYDGVYTESEIELTKALHYLNDSDNHLLLYQCLSLQGGNLEALSLYDEALDYYKKAQKIIPKLDVIDAKKFYYVVLNTVDLSNVYAAQGAYDQTLKVLSEIDLNRLREYRPSVYAIVVSNIAYSKLNLYGPTKEVKKLLLEAHYYTEKYGNDKDIVFKYKYLGEYYMMSNDKFNATKNFKIALDAAITTEYNIEIVNLLKLLSQSDGDNFDSYHTEYLDRYQNLIDKQIKTKNKFARIEYETRRVEDINRTLNNRLQYIIYLVVILILIIAIFSLSRILKFNKLALSAALQKNEAEQNLFELLKQQQTMINKAQEKEKKRIALELHDGVMNKLYSTRLNLGVLNKNIDTESIDSRKKLIKDLQNIEAEIRSLSHNLSTTDNDSSNDYKKLLTTLVNNQNSLQQTLFQIQINDEKKLTELDTIYKFNIYRIIQECIFNIQKHAKAETADILLHIFEQEIKLIIKDDGIGYNVEDKKEGIGISNIKYRLKTLNGKIKIKSELGNGTRIIVTIPIASNI